MGGSGGGGSYGVVMGFFLSGDWLAFVKTAVKTFANGYRQTNSMLIGLSKTNRDQTLKIR